MNTKPATPRIPLEQTAPEEGDLLPDSVRAFDTSERLSRVENALCDGEGGAAPSKGTRAS